MFFLTHYWFWLMVATLFIVAHGYERDERPECRDHEHPDARPEAARDGQAPGQTAVQPRQSPRNHH